MIRTGEIEKLCEKYGLNKTELVCCVLYFQFENKTFAHAESIGKSKRYKHPDMAALNFFNRADIQEFILKEKQNFFAGYRVYSDMEPEQTNKKNNSTEIQKDSFVPLFTEVELTKDNLKKFLEIELSRITDPKDRAGIFIKAAEFLSLNDSGNVDFEKPVIYLPDRMAETVL